MPLINKKLLQNTLSKHKHEIGSSQKAELQTLFKQTLERIDKKKFKSGRGLPVGKASLAPFGKEESEKVPFLQKMFELLGYKLHENLEFEFSTRGRSIDGVLGLQTENGRNVEVAIEWKGINTKSLDGGKAGETPVSQMWDYMGKVGAEIGIVGNFVEWRLYTLQTKQSEYFEFNLRNLAENEDKLDELIFLLRKNTLLKTDKKHSLLQDLISQSEAEQEQITKNFYSDYKQRRTNLFNHLIQNNEGKDKYLLLEKTQKILDRLIFIMFCEDGYLLPSGTIRQVFESAKNSFGSQTKIWDFFKGLFLAIDKGNDYPKINAFNGGLFAGDLELNNLIIKDEIWQDLIKLSQYNFESDLNVNILGHIFEQSISDIEEIKADLEGETADKKKSKRKKDGIYYTPEYITDYIVSETVNNWLAENNEQIEKIKILDPAGGSGAFPNQVHSYLAKKHAENANQKAIESGLETFATIDETQIDKSILQNNIYMVDLQPESVEIAKLSLWLKTARKDQKLNNLDENVKVGNSLIDDPEIAGDLAFDWNQEFPEVMANGGFDVVVGNPPYVNAKNGNFKEKEKEYFNKNYETAEYQLDTYILFIERAVNMLNAGGYLGFIIPNPWLGNVFVPKIREFLLKNTEIKGIVELGNSVFEDANVDTVILIVKKCIPNPEHEIKISYFVDQKYEFRHLVKQSLFLENKGFVFDINLNDKNREIIEKMEEYSISIGEILEVTRGVNPYDKARGQTEDTIKNRIYHSDYKKDDTFVPEIKGADVNRFETNWSGKTYISYGNWLAAPREPKFFEGERILLRKIPAPENLIATFTDEKFIIDQSLYIALNEEKKLNTKYILACLNSKVLGWYFKYKNNEFDELFPQIKIDQFKSLPIPKATTEQQTQIAELVDQIMELKQNNQKLTNSLLNLIKAKYKPSTISTKLKKWHELETAEFLDELKKQKAKFSLSEQAELITYFEMEKAKVLELGQEAEKVDEEIEVLVRGLYGVKK